MQAVDAQQQAGLVLVLSGPSGVGKTSLCRCIRAMMPEVTTSVSCTTRPPRPGEQDGQDYHFLSHKAFDAHVAAGDFLEWAVVHGNRYGTLRQSVYDRTAAGQDVLLTIDVQGAAHLRAANLDAVYVFVLAPSMAVLEARLQQRGSETEAARQHRLAVAREELHHYTEYDYVVYNAQLAAAAETLRAIIIAERHRVARLGPVPLEGLWQCHPMRAPGVLGINDVAE
jgi:guanylate kinase